MLLSLFERWGDYSEYSHLFIAVRTGVFKGETNIICQHHCLLFKHCGEQVLGFESLYFQLKMIVVSRILEISNNSFYIQIIAKTLWSRNDILNV